MVVVFAVVVGKKFDALVLEWLLCAKPRICREREKREGKSWGVLSWQQDTHYNNIN